MTDAGSATGGFVAATTKTSIQVENTGNIPAYIRLRFVSCWVDADGHIVGKASVMPAIPYDDAHWFQVGDTYYCKDPIEVGAFTPELLKDGSIVLDVDESTGYRQVLEVFADAIQSKPAKAVTQSWGVSISGDRISP
jgi:hypothetical protein